jgi:hypothetical protein
MNPSVPEVFDAALALDEDDRARLAATLVASLDGERDADAASAWGAEIERRLARIDAGEATLLSASDVIDRLRATSRGR